jgi:HEPN domain-containing protein
MAAQRDLANQLLDLARDDQVAAKTLLDGEAAESIVGFHCQQAVEKALKAILADDGLQFPYTHDIELLVELCADAGAPTPDHLADVDRLTPFAARVRYGTAPAPDVDLATCVDWAAQTITWAAEQVATRPLSDEPDGDSASEGP